MRGPVALLVLCAFFGCVVGCSECYKRDGRVKKVEALHPLRANQNWTECVELLGEQLCVVAFVDPQDLDVGFEFTLNGVVIYKEVFNGSDICLDQDALLYLLELIPALAPFKKLIDDLIKVLHHIPGNVFSICLKLSDVKITDTDFHACAHLEETVICWEGKCLVDTTEDLGCFDIPI